MSEALSVFAQAFGPASLLLTVYYLGRRSQPSRNSSQGRYLR